MKQRLYIPYSRTKIPRRVFISSTVHDLQVERESIKAYLDDKGYEVFASEFPAFPVSEHEHSYQTCIDTLNKCDICILIIGYRYGGTIKQTANEVSITRQEYNAAYDSGKYIISFVRKELQEEAKIFKDSYKASKHKDKEKVFARLSRSAKWKADNHRIFDFMDQITQGKRDNWICFFDNITEIYSHLKARLSGIQKDTLKISSPALQAIFSHEDNTYPIKMNFYDPSFEPFPGLGHLLLSTRLLSSDALSNPEYIQRISNAFHDNLVAIVRKGYFNAEYAASGRRNKIFFSLDTLTDLGHIDAWLKDTILVHYLKYTGQSAKRSGKETQFVRMIVVFEPGRVITDTSYRANIVSLINEHQRLNIRIGFVRIDLIPDEFNVDLIDFNSIVGENVNFFSPRTGIGQIIDRKISKDKVASYEDLYILLHNACINRDRACYVTGKASDETIVNILKPLF